MTPPTRYTGNTQEVLDTTATQVQAIIDRLQPDHTLPRKPTRGSLWHQLQDSISDAYLALAREHGSRGGRAIIMAGSPGAGKSQAVATTRKVLGPARSKQVGAEEDGYTTIDADDIKQLLLGNPVPGLDVSPELLAHARAHWDNLIATHASEPLADGHPITRGELATLVHPLSTSAADLARNDLLRRRFDVKIEGTLIGRNKGSRLIRELEAARYTQVTVVAVNTPEHVCLKGARDRWAGPRSQGDPTARYTPPTAVTATFTTGPGHNRTCRCIENAQATHRLATTSTTLTNTDLLVTHRTEYGPTVIDHTDRDGNTHTYSAPHPVLAAIRPPHTLQAATAKSSTASAVSRQPPTREGVLRNVNTPRPYTPKSPRRDRGLER
ncbi:hypothetical protein GZ998_07700 [Actinomyces sp. 594]|uniref:zeta toxin family protein n=1 Tax=Actinomyces sp. 594 TaxID=2057793 RepID=UPI001C57AF0D|nr:zeta toxin family protein [Actinomyces sp. 594]MBW3069384.1 hypothetical protein [Actinomyces sp. 594]